MKKIICLLLAVATLATCTLSALALENAEDAKKDIADKAKFEQSIIDDVCESVIESYAEYYTIPSIHGEISDVEQVSGGTRYIVDVEFTKVLLAESASELPYIQGMEAAVEKIEDAEQKAAAQATLDARKYEIDTMYIGAQQYESSTFSVVVPDTASIAKADKDEYVMSFVGEFGEMDMEAFAPQSREELYHDGETRAAQIAESVAISQTLASPAAAQTTKTNPSDPTDYDRVAARDYARKYSCGKCTKSPHTCRNKEYEFYNGADCANFVSQAIYAGGISQESRWYPGTTTWINTGWREDIYGLAEYMVDQGFFFESTNKHDAFAGSIIYWNQYSHVGMVDANDSVTLTFCAHTGDRKSLSFKNWNGATADTDVKFYVPVWDSYAGTYTAV